MKETAIRSKVKHQILGTKNGPSGGGTIGPKIEYINGVATIDTGVGCYAMHSCREMMDVDDIDSLVNLLEYILMNFEELRTYTMVNV